MSIEDELKKDGIEVVEILSSRIIDNIAKKVSSQICKTFPNFGLLEFDLYKSISKVYMYKAKMPERNVRSKLFL